MTQDDMLNILLFELELEVFKFRLSDRFLSHLKKIKIKIKKIDFYLNKVVVN